MIKCFKIREKGDWMGKRILICLIAAVLLLPVVMAIDTQINVRALPEHKVSIFVLDSDKVYSVIHSAHIQSGNSGEVSTTYSGNKPTIKVNVQIKKDGDSVQLERFDEFPVGNPLYLEVKPGSVSRNYMEGEEEDDPVEEEADAEGEISEGEEGEGEDVGGEEESTGDSGITGSAISDNEAGEDDELGLGLSNTTYFIIAGVVVAVVILLFILKLSLPGMKKDPAYKYKSVSAESSTAENSEDGGNNSTWRERKLERKLEAAQAEIEKLKLEEQNAEKIAEVRRRLQEDKEELRKLRKG
jgi:hypothetical protein